MAVILATNENYAQIVSQPGLTVVMYDHLSDNSYCNVRKIRAAHRKLAKLGTLRVVLVDLDHFDYSLAPPRIGRYPMFRVYEEGRLLANDSGPVRSVDKWLIEWAQGFSSSR